MSVYGVRGLAANVHEWTSNEEVVRERARQRVSRIGCGGGWDGTPLGCRVSHCTGFEPKLVYVNLGLRVARSLR